MDQLVRAILPAPWLRPALTARLLAVRDDEERAIVAGIYKHEAHRLVCQMREAGSWPPGWWPVYENEAGKRWIFFEGRWR